jgi:hypothetical protein
MANLTGGREGPLRAECLAVMGVHSLHKQCSRTPPGRALSTRHSHHTAHGAAASTAATRTRERIQGYHGQAYIPPCTQPGQRGIQHTAHYAAWTPTSWQPCRAQLRLHRARCRRAATANFTQASSKANNGRAEHLGLRSTPRTLRLGQVDIYSLLASTLPTRGV